MERSKRQTMGFEIAIVVLVALLITALALIVSMAVRPSQPEALAEISTNQQPSRCHDDIKGSVCFNTTVKNVGAVESTFLCQVSAADASQATFPPGGSANTEVFLQPANTVTVQSIVTPAVAGAVTSPPNVACSPVSP
jgi:hypothetical protein